MPGDVFAFIYLHLTHFVYNFVWSANGFWTVGRSTRVQLLHGLDGRTPLAGDDLHELEAAVVQLDLSGVVVLAVDLTSA